MKILTANEDGEIMKVYDYETCLESLKYHLKTLHQQVKKLEEENKRLKDEHYKDEELSKMKKDLAQMRREMAFGFPITAEQHEAIMRWKREHWRKIHQGVSHSVSYKFLPTPLGVSAEVKCISCGEVFEFQTIY